MNTFRRLCLAALSVTALAACSMTPRPSELDTRLTRPSEHGLYIVTMHPLVEAPKMNTIHAWEVAVTNSAGAPVRDAKFTFAGGMPEHGHGYPTKPRVTGSLGEGRYRLDGVKFSMSGWWTMVIAVESAAGTDQVVFNTIVAPDGKPLRAGAD